MATSSQLRMLTRSPVSRPFICRSCLPSSRVENPVQTRSLSTESARPPQVPSPTPFVPDVSTFLSLIGRNLSNHASKFTTWESLFKLSSPQLKELGIEPARSRRYLLRWREKFRRGEYGIGGDFQHVLDGVGELKVVEVPALTPAVAAITDGSSTISSSQQQIRPSTSSLQKLIVNIPRGSATYLLSRGQTTRDLIKPQYISLQDGHRIIGSYVQPVKGTNGSGATLKVTEGLWEDRRGRKVFGGERRRAETLHKMRAAERKKNER